MKTSRIQRIRSNQQIHNHSTVKQIHRPQIRDTEVAPPAAGKVADRLRECFESFQLKYDVDAGSPWWRKLFFWYVYLPFVRFAYFTVGIVPLDHVNEQGQLGWLERQTIWSEKWRAEKDAARYPFGGVQRLPFDIEEQEETCAPQCEFPNSSAKHRYERRANRTVPVAESALERLERKLLETDPVVNRYRAKSA